MHIKCKYRRAVAPTRGAFLVFNMVTFKCSFPVHLLKNIGFLHKIYNYECFSFTINFLSTYNKKLQ